MATHDILFDRIVLVGCVLPRRFNWQAVFTRAPSDPHVRNEVGSSDFVARLVGLTAWLTRGELGSAGRNGFLPGEHEVHSISNPWDACTRCGPCSTAKVHNVTLEKYGHSTWTLGIGHILQLWLPYLWGYPPDEFSAWLTTCTKATRALQMGASENYAQAVGSLLSRQWAWTAKGGTPPTPRTLAVYLASHIGAENATSVQGKVMQQLVHAVHLAQEAAVEDIDSNEKIRWRLHPKAAIDYTLADVLASDS